MEGMGGGGGGEEKKRERGRRGQREKERKREREGGGDKRQGYNYMSSTFIGSDSNALTTTTSNPKQPYKPMIDFVTNLSLIISLKLQL